ncbi:ROK family protein [Algihabitans albus]|uniref:ROK family protein n=1 Tax=Algihabitans albus TaxID=2164067 RepID=UPI000E5C96BF|nr:ROK family protein [Algihabitans albus]
MRIGLDLGGTKISGVVLQASGAEVLRRRRATPQGDYDATLVALRDLVGELESAAGTACSVGVGCPGAISPNSGLIKNANSTYLIDKPFDKDLAEALSRPIRIENDANCLALSEAVDGAAAGAQTVFGAVLGTGVGGGIVLGGQVWRGRDAIAGEWGHNPLSWPQAAELPGRLCYCGRRGCIETWLSGPALGADYDEATTSEMVVARAAAGEPAAAAALARYRDRLARALATVVNLLDPDAIVLGGGLSRVPALYDGLDAAVGAYVFSDIFDTPIRPALHGDDSGVRGAAWLWPLESSP